ncbi:4-amino-4-deoxy-L-arabinose transferase [Curtobacterium sp. MCPF17_011]|uniref:YrdB family protein n=1 Tax=Curtobacterium sp. MCPF17_011 TaxID=2175652 RepID=UPI000DA9043E|nr:YrdB family protein [Curtobacterium sp. MCPF17_011]PZF15232.1 4-amino-4-deoxy-L-arabinose transferase [Curtobacterium sp. MCPF17_011]
MHDAPRSPIDPGDDHVPATHAAAGRRFDVWSALRFLVCAFGLLSLAYWGYLTWPYPFPALFFIVGAPLFAALVWFFFRSPNSPVETDVVGKTIVEVALVVAAGATWISLGHPAVGLVFVVVAAVSGIVAARRETA